MMNEFFGHNPQYESQISSDNFFGYSKLHHQLNLGRQVNQTGDWANEFAYQINPIMGGLTTSEKGIMEKAFSESKVTSGKSQKATGKDRKNCLCKFVCVCV